MVEDVFVDSQTALGPDPSSAPAYSSPCIMSMGLGLLNCKTGLTVAGAKTAERVAWDDGQGG